MRRRAYPYGRYLIRDREVDELGPEFKEFIESYGFHVSKYDRENEGEGTVIIAENKTIMELLRKKKPPGKLKMILSTFSFAVPSFKNMDEESQRIGVEIYLWPIDEGTLLEVFILPYMEHLNRPEIFGLTETEDEEITEWYLCEQTWEHLIPEMNETFEMERVHRRG